MQKKVVAAKSIRFQNNVSVYYLLKNKTIFKISRLNDEPYDIKEHVEIVINEIVITLIQKSSNPIDQEDNILFIRQPQLTTKDLRAKDSCSKINNKAKYNCGCILM